MRFRALAVLFAVVGALIVVTGAPAGAQEAPANVTGEVECTTPGVFTVTWTIENAIGADGEVDSAVLSGAAEGDIADSFDPNPFSGDDETIVGSSEISGDTVGTVTILVTITFELKGPFTTEAGADLTLDGSCEAPPPTEASTTSSSVATAPAATTRPAFTG